MYKILDGCVKIKLEGHDETQNMMHQNQGWFKKREGTREHIYVVQPAFHHNPTIYYSVLDLQKAYDSIWKGAFITKLEKQCRVPQQTVQLLEAMYNNALLCTRVRSKLSPVFQTFNWLQQGALSSSILFNYYINDLIDLLNNTRMGINIGRLAMNDLLFADDMMLMTKNKEHLHQLLSICTNWANEWKLKFSPNKSKTLTNLTHAIS